MIYNTDARQLHKKGEEAIKIFQTKKHTLDEKIALYNYIAMIYPALADVRGGKYKLSSTRIFSTQDDYIRFLQLQKACSSGAEDIFIKYKEFHKEYISNVFLGVTNILFNVPKMEYSDDSVFNGKDFFYVFYLFMKSLGIEDIFLDLLNNGQIYGTAKPSEKGTSGYTIFNPFNGDSNIFINYFDFDISSMFTIAHEMGHVYDFKNISINMKDYNIYQYQSFYREVISKLFEKLFIDFMLKNNIKKTAAIDILFDIELINYQYLFRGYIFSLLDDEIIEDAKYRKLSNNQLALLVKDGFKGYKSVKSFLDDESMPIDLNDSMTYMYGDIISMFLFERIKEDNYSLDSLKLFFEKCHGLFDIDSFMSVAGSSDEYLELYKKETKILVKK